MADTDAVLRANEMFYAAFAAADMAAMADLWARDAPVAVIHPGTLPVSGHERVVASWREILAPASAVDIVCIDPRVQLHGDVAVVLCQELVNGHVLAATNMFKRGDHGWRIILHQAGAVAARLAPARSRGVH